MILAVVNRAGFRQAELFFTKREFRQETSNAEVLASVEMVIRGKTYRERQECLRDIAIQVQRLILDPAFLDAVWWLEGGVREYFRTNGKRYGLPEEFRENDID